MTLVQFFSILRARWKAGLLVLAAVVMGTALVNTLVPNSYTASVAVLVDVKSPDPIAGIIFPGMNAPRLHGDASRRDPERSRFPACRSHIATQRVGGHAPAVA